MPMWRVRLQLKVNDLNIKCNINACVQGDQASVPGSGSQALVQGTPHPLMQHSFIFIITGLDALYKDLSIVEPRLLMCLDKLGNSQVRELLCRLQVHELEPKEVLQKHIYPILKSSAWKVRTHSAQLC